jgi:hypothetical protein
MKATVILVIFVILTPFYALGAVAANFGAGPADVGASSPSPVPGGVGYTGNGADYIYQAGVIPTALIIHAPTTIYVKETLTVSFRLVRTDTGDGIPHATVRGHFSRDGINWSEPRTLRTDGNGQFSYTSTVPDDPGIYYGYLSYDGNNTYQGCTSATYTVTVLSQVSTPAGLRPADSR